MNKEKKEKNEISSASIRESVFGIEDGMVSTLGAITGIATATSSFFTVVLAGFVVISVESISMAVGSYLSSKSEREIDMQRIEDQREKVLSSLKDGKNTLYKLYIADGWPKALAEKMVQAAGRKKELLVRELACHGLSIIPDKMEQPFKNGVIMWLSYIIGGFVPLLPYLLFRSIEVALPISVIITLIGLFLLGVGTTKFSKRTWWKAGLEMFLLASAAAIIGYAVGQLVDLYFGLGPAL